MNYAISRQKLVFLAKLAELQPALNTINKLFH